MANQLPSGRWRGRVRHPRTGKQVAPHTVIGGPKTYPTKRAAERAEDEARDALLDIAERGTTVREWWHEWTSSPLWARPASQRTSQPRADAKFVAAPTATARSLDRPCVVAEWLRGGREPRPASPRCG